MPQSSYAYAIGRIRVLENRLLGHEKIDRMVEAATAEDALKILAESEYGQGQEMSDAHEYEKLLSSELEKTYQFIEAVTPNKSATDLFLLQYDIHNLKVLLKARFLDNVQHEPLSALGTIPADSLRAAVSKAEYTELPEFMAEALKELEAGFEERIDPHRIETALDQAYNEHIFHVCRKSRNAFLKEYFVRRADLLNIRTLLRVKKTGEDRTFLRGLLLEHGSIEHGFFEDSFDESPEQIAHSLRNSEYGKVVADGVQDFIRSGNLTVYERLMDNYLLNFVKSRKYSPLGLEPIIGYILAKENEIKMARMILVGKMNNIANEKIRERLRDMYA